MKRQDIASGAVLAIMIQWKVRNNRATIERQEFAAAGVRSSERRVVVARAGARRMLVVLGKLRSIGFAADSCPGGFFRARAGTSARRNGAADIRRRVPQSIDHRSVSRLDVARIDAGIRRRASQSIDHRPVSGFNLVGTAQCSAPAEQLYAGGPALFAARSAGLWRAAKCRRSPGSARGGTTAAIGRRASQPVDHRSIPSVARLALSPRSQ